MLSPDIERRRQAASARREWTEQHRLRVVSHDGRFGIATQVGWLPSAGSASFQAVVFEPGRPPIVLAESDIRAPTAGWELRSSGLWADHLCETPFDHWSYGLEAFALAIDDPAELLGRGFGERIPLGWELEFEAGEQPVVTAGFEATEPESDPGADESAYSQRGTAHGLLLIGRRRLEVAGPAERAHRWGTGRFPPDTALPSDTALPGATGAADDRSESATEVALPAFGGTWWVAPTEHGLATRLDPAAR